MQPNDNHTELIQALYQHLSTHINQANNNDKIIYIKPYKTKYQKIKWKDEIWDYTLDSMTGEEMFEFQHLEWTDPQTIQKLEQTVFIIDDVLLDIVLVFVWLVGL